MKPVSRIQGYIYIVDKVKSNDLDQMNRPISVPSIFVDVCWKQGPKDEKIVTTHKKSSYST